MPKRSTRILKRRRFLLGAGAALVSLAGASYIGLRFARRSNDELLRRISLLHGQHRSCTALPGLNDYKGVIHVHSRVSRDCQGTPDEIIRAAKEAGLNFLFITDHNSKKIFTEGMQGTYDGIVVIRGAEMINKGQGLLAINVKEYIDGHRMTVQQAVNEIKSQGGLAFVAHPWRFTKWDVRGIDGIEIYDLADSTYAHLWKTPLMLADEFTSAKDLPEEAFVRGPLSRPDYYLSKWDKLIQKKKLVGIAGNDAHQNTVVFGKLLDPYSVDFKFLQTHILAARLDEAALLRALQAGHTYCSFGLLADATGFHFEARNREVLGIMGDDVPYSSQPILTAEAPHDGIIRLYRNGQPIQTANGNRLDHPVAGKGIYRVEVALEVEREEYPWIFSNPIYVT
ncbi:CehA/McbA family metallohydrolase [Sulfuricaulis sp.]|jgi:hypothetical protein|uniref:CehA/McbA family metallohydrolase n=1 Tax=Sulfuricaulis sp. TaxID=2003553 RepID=UPI003559A856